MPRRAFLGILCDFFSHFFLLKKGHWTLKSPRQKCGPKLLKEDERKVMGKSLKSKSEKRNFLTCGGVQHSLTLVRNMSLF